MLEWSNPKKILKEPQTANTCSKNTNTCLRYDLGLHVNQLPLKLLWFRSSNQFISCTGLLKPVTIPAVLNSQNL